MLSVRSEAALGKLEPGSTVILLPWRSQSSYRRQGVPPLFFSPTSISNLLASVHWEGGLEHELLGAHKHTKTHTNAHGTDLVWWKEQLREKWGRIIRGNGWWRLYWLEQLHWSSSHCSNYHQPVGASRCRAPFEDHDVKDSNIFGLYLTEEQARTLVCTKFYIELKQNSH